MIELLSAYSITQILTFVIIFAIAIKQFITFVDWAKDRINKHLKNKETPEKQINELQEKNKEQDEKISQLLNSQTELNKDVQRILTQLDGLISSDKDAIKAYITKEHHYFCYQTGWIDDYNLDCIERRYKHYKDLGGNSFAAALMDELRSLPRQPMGKQKNEIGGEE